MMGRAVDRPGLATRFCCIATTDPRPCQPSDQAIILGKSYCRHMSGLSVREGRCEHLASGVNRLTADAITAGGPRNAPRCARCGCSRTESTAALARMETQVAFSELAHRFPN